jgi:glutathione synthase
MTKKILFIADDIAKFNLATDTTYLTMLTCYDMGIEVFYCTVKDLYVADGSKVFASVQNVEILYSLDKLYTPNWYKIGTAQKLDLVEFDTVLVRKDPPFDLEYYMMTQILSIAIQNGAKIFNHPDALRNYNEKLTTLQFPHLVVPSIVSKDKKQLLEFVEYNQDCIIKPLNMMAGAGVLKTNKEDSNLSVLLELSSQNFSQTIIVQKFIPAVALGDRRVFIINGKVLDYCLVRIPANNSVRSNIAAGGTGVVEALTQETREIAQEVADWANNIMNLNFIGLDIIGGYLNEINITSPTGLHQIYKHTGVNGAELWLKACLA